MLFLWRGAAHASRELRLEGRTELGLRLRPARRVGIGPKPRGSPHERDPNLDALSDRVRGHTLLKQQADFIADGLAADIRMAAKP
jgi:hypothetical protein